MKELQTTSMISPWIVSTKPEGYELLHEDDDISTAKNVGEITIKKFHSHGIFFIKDLKRLSDQDATTLNTTAKIRSFKSIRAAACVAAPGKDPYPIINLSKTDRDGKPTSNPYHSRFGDSWRSEIMKSTALSPLVCVTELVKFMMAESARIMAGTVHADDWYFYHDALSLMTAKQTHE